MDGANKQIINNTPANLTILRCVIDIDGRYINSSMQMALRSIDEMGKMGGNVPYWVSIFIFVVFFFRLAKHWKSWLVAARSQCGVHSFIGWIIQSVVFSANRRTPVHPIYMRESIHPHSSIHTGTPQRLSVRQNPAPVANSTKIWPRRWQRAEFIVAPTIIDCKCRAVPFAGPS